MKKKYAIVTIAVAIVFSLSTMGMSFANNEFMFFTDCDYWDNECVKFIGSVNAHIDDNNQLSISIADAYPGYIAFVSFEVTHVGTSDEDPNMYLTDIEYINGNENALSIVVSDLTVPMGDPISPGGVLNGLVTIEVLNEAEQNFEYSFAVLLHFSDIS